MANLVLNPSAATDLTGWADSGASLARVTSVPGTTIPSPATTAFRVDTNEAIEAEPISLPGNVSEGDVLWLSLDVSPGETAPDGTWQIAVDWYDGASETGYADLVQADPIAAGWTHYEGALTIPASVDGFDVYVTNNGSTTAVYIYATNVSVEAVSLMEADGEIEIDGSADLTLETNMAASGTITLSGSAWLSVRDPGQDTFAASGTIYLRGRARLSTDADPALPPTDEDGWTLPDVTVPDIVGLSVTLSGLAVSRAQIEDLTIELDVAGGPKSASISLNCPLDRAPRIGRGTLLVTYKTQVLFRGLLHNIVGDVSSSTGYTLTYAGPLAKLRDHKAYRQVFVDSDLDSWRVDQGPQTSPDTFDGITAGVW